jgi:type IV secretory pathway VirB9-like protein
MSTLARVAALVLTLALLAGPTPVVHAQATGIREVSASERVVIPVKARLRYTTMLVLPEGEEILDVICGDKDFWIISATQNVAHVKPAKENSSTNLNLVTSSGSIYSFMLSEKNGGTPDLKVYIKSDTNETSSSRPKYYRAEQIEGLQNDLAAARAAVDTAQKQATETIAAYRQQYPSRLQFQYGTPKYEKPFFVRAIWHDGQFTFIKADATELPALYELKDGAPALVNFQVESGTYVIPKVVERGYLTLGKARWTFNRQGR